MQVSDFQNKFDKKVWNVVLHITSGCVMSYGEVACIAGYPRYARMVSKAMGRSDKQLPWYRVVRSNRTLAFKVGSSAYDKQRCLLEKEGVCIVNGRVVSVDSGKDLDELIWGP